MFWLTPIVAGGAPSPEQLQDAVNTVSQTGQKIVRSSLDALETATKTMSAVAGPNRPHDKGVAGSNDGWKVTYVTYRSYDEGASPQPVLYLIIQSLTAASDAQLGDLNRALYQAVEEGVDIKSALRGIVSTAVVP